MHKLLVMCVDALFTTDLPDTRHLPGFSCLMEHAAIFELVESVYPTLTYVCHASICSGFWPEHTGVPHNQKLDPATRNEEWYWDYSAIKVPTIFDWATKQGLTTASVGWPVSKGAPVTYGIPEVWEWSRRPTPEDAFRDGCNEDGWEYVKRHLSCYDTSDMHPTYDEFEVRCLEDLIREKAPDVILDHQAQLDHVRHVSGVHAPEVQDALRLHDGWLQRIFAAYEDAGVLDDTVIVVLGDHGQLEVDYKLSANVLLAQAGLLETDERGEVSSWRAYVQSGGISAELFVKDESFVEPALNALRPLFDEGYVTDAFTNEEAQQKFHTAGSFSYIFEAAPNYAFGDDAEGALVTPAGGEDYKYSLATHGHLPFRGEKPCCIMMGPGVKPGRYQGLRLIDEAPTAMKLAGIPFDEDMLDGRSFF
ncbi:MAG: alkaline phosphatase family protein [Atopobium sp.]|nr:alkaline phosphatase family protein [Atopobium sp.]